MFNKYLILLCVSYVSVNCQTANNVTTKVVTNMDNTSNMTKMIVLEFVNGMGRALQQLLTANSVVNRQTVDYNSTAKQDTNQTTSRIEGEKLREEINKRVNQLQTIIATAIQVSKDRRDVMTRRVLEQINQRLEGAKDRADKILSEVCIPEVDPEPNNSEIAVRTLRTINTGISNLSTFANTVLSRVNVSINVNLKQPDTPESPAIKP